MIFVKIYPNPLWNNDRKSDFIMLKIYKIGISEGEYESWTRS